MSVEVGTAYLTIVPSARGFAGRIRSQIGGDMETAGREGGQRMQNGMLGVAAGAGKALGAAVMVGAGGLAGLGALGLKAGLDTAKGMETARISFTTMLGSGQKADAFLKQLSDFAAKTPFEFPELQTAASSLISAGFEANKVIPIMTTLGDVTSGMGTGAEGIQRATVALQQMSAAGRISGEDLNQLRDAGIPVYDLLASATGKSKEAVSALAQSGKLGKKEMQQLFDALGSGKGLERFKGLMDKQSQSLDGMLSTAKDTLNMGLANAVTPLIPLIKDGLGRFSDLAAKAMPVLANALKMVIEGGMRLADVLGPAFTNIGKAVSPVIDTVKLFIGTLTGQGADVDLPWMNTVIDLGAQTATVFSQISDTVKLFFGTISGQGADVDLPWMDQVIDAGGLVATILHDQLPAAIGLAQDAFASIASFVVNEVVPRIFDIYKAVGGFISVALPIVIQFVNGMRQRIEPLMPQIRTIFATIGVIISAALVLVKSIIEAATTVIGYIWRTWGQNIMDFIATVFRNVLNVIQSALSVVMAVVRTFIAIFHGDWSGAWAGVLQILSTTWDLIKTVVGAALGVIKAALSLTWSVILVGLRAAWGLIRDAIAGAWNSIVANVSTKLGEIKKWISDAWDGIKAAATGAWNGIVTAVSAALSGLWTAVTAPFKTVLSWIRDNFVNPLNDMLSKVGVDFRIPFPSFSDGGAVPSRGSRGSLGFGFAGGGYTGPGGKYQPAGIVHAGEVVFSQEDVARHGGVSMVEALRVGGLPGHADGGIVGALRSAGSAVGGAVSSAASAVGSFVGDVGEVLRDPVGAVKRIVSNILGGIGSSPAALMARGALSRVGDGLAGKVQDLLGSMLGGGVGQVTNLGAGRVSIGGKVLDATTANIFQRASAMLGGLTLMQGSFSTSVGASGGTHSGTGAMDVWPANGDWRRAVDVIRSLGGIAWHRTPSQGPWAEHIHSITPGIPGLSAAAAAQVANFRAGQNGLVGGGPDNHGYFGGGPVTPLLFDQGGYLPTGPSLVVNNTGAPEPLKRVDKADKTFIINGNVGYDYDELAREIDDRERRSATINGLMSMVG